MTFKLFSGNRDIIDTLEEAVEMARKGKLIGITLCGVGIDDDGSYGIGNQSAWNEDMISPWSHLLAAVADAQHHLLSEGLVDTTK